MGAINTIDQVVKHPQVQARDDRRERASRRRQSQARRGARETVRDAWECAGASAAAWAAYGRGAHEYLGMTDGNIYPAPGGHRYKEVREEIYELVIEKLPERCSRLSMKRSMASSARISTAALMSGQLARYDEYDETRRF